MTAYSYHNGSLPPAGAGQYRMLRELLRILGPGVMLAVLLAVMWLSSTVLPQPALWVGLLMLIVAVTIVVLMARHYARFTERYIDRMGARREQQLGVAKQAWARQVGWSFQQGPGPIDDGEAVMLLPPETQPVAAYRRVAGRRGSFQIRMETWLLARPQRRARQQRRRDGKVPFYPILSTVTVLQSHYRLRQAGFISHIHLPLPTDPPEHLADVPDTNERSVIARVYSPHVTVEQLLTAQVTEGLQELARAPVRIISSGYTLAMLSVDEPDVEVLAQRMDSLVKIASGLRD